MALRLPFTYYRCSCVDASPSLATRSSQKFARLEDEEQTFDPKSPRANYSLFPLEHLLYCTECHQVRCSRCILEEIVCWYCPSCLFEVPSSTVRSEGNRCNRSCYNCPLCTSPLTVSSIEPPIETDATSTDALPTGPFILSCLYCAWTSLDIGLKFEKHNNITTQLQKIYNRATFSSTLHSPSSPISRLEEATTSNDKSFLSLTESSQQSQQQPPDAVDPFTRLNQFYKTQLAESSDSFGPGGGYGGLADLNYSSPSSISRLLNLYSSAGKGKANKRQKPQPLREALSPSEGLRVFNPSADSAAIQRLRDEGWDATASTEQKNFQTEGRERARFKEDLRPVATLLRTKRSKRCRACRTLLSRPEPKVSSTRYKIKVLALNNIPRLTIRPLPSSQSSAVLPTSTTAVSTTPGLGKGEDGSADSVLQPLLPQQVLLTLTNPLFDPIRVTLATPSSTPGPVSSRVTILCPQFDVGANTDVWDDALNTRETRRRSTLGGHGIGAASSSSGGPDTGERQAEAGKVWERGRNWTSVIVEVVPGPLPGSSGAGVGFGLTDQSEELGEDEDVLEIPVFVRIEYDTEVQGGAEEKGEGKGGKETREVSFWCVLGIGRIAAWR